MRISIISLFLLCISFTSYAMNNSFPLNAKDIAPGTNEGRASLGFGQIADDKFLQLQIGTELSFGKVGMGLLVPLNLRIIDKDPKADNDFLGVIRHEDWDEARDYLRIFRYVRYGQKREPVYVVVGDLLNGKIGHGTILNRYQNNLDLDIFNLGFIGDVNTLYGGVETLFNDITDPNLIAIRGYVKPYSFIDKNSLFAKISTGLSVITDKDAPKALQIDTASQLPELDERNKYLVAEKDSVTAIGIDTEWELFTNDFIQLIPYIDYNTFAGAGWGTHLGNNTVFTFPAMKKFFIDTTLEYRIFESDYQPTYFDAFYEIHKFALPQSTIPKWAFLDGLNSDPLVHGWYAEAMAMWLGVIGVKGIYEDYNTGLPNAAAYLDFPLLDSMILRGYYYKTSVKNWGDLFQLDDRSLLTAQIGFQVIPFTYLMADFTRTYQINTLSRQYEAVDSWQFGVQARFTF